MVIVDHEDKTGSKKSNKVKFIFTMVKTFLCQAHTAVAVWIGQVLHDLEVVSSNPSSAGILCL